MPCKRGCAANQSRHRRRFENQRRCLPRDSNRPRNQSTRSIPGYGGFVGWESPIRLKSGVWIVGFNAGYWHASPPTPLHYPPQTLAEYRKMGMPDVAAPTGGRAMFIRSTDEGKTWSKPQTLIDTPADDRHPAFVQLRDGTVLCCFFTYMGQPENDDFAKHPELATHVDVIRSFDDGKTWEKKPIMIKTPFLSDEADGPLVLMKDGSVVLAINGRPKTDHQTRRGRAVDGPRRDVASALSTVKISHDLWELSAVELRDGEMVMIARPEGDICWSHDHGHTWTEPGRFGCGCLRRAYGVARRNVGVPARFLCARE